jgi:class 3 adenylate cyclase
MTFEEILDHAIAMLQRRRRLTYSTLKRQFQLDDAALEDLKNELIEGQRLAVDEQGNVLVWTGAEISATHATAPPASTPDRAPLAYTPTYLAEKILTSKSALEGERKQVTVLFADLTGSTELIRDLDPEQARSILDPALHAMMEAVHRYEGTVNQVLGDGIMALFGAPLAMQDALRRYAEEVRRTHGLTVQMRVGLNAGEVVVRAIGNDLHMDYSAVGLTTVLAARMEQLATPGSILLTAATLRLVEGMVQVNPPRTRAGQRGGRARGGLRAGRGQRHPPALAGRGGPRAHPLCRTADGASGAAPGAGAGGRRTRAGGGAPRRGRRGQVAPGVRGGALAPHPRLAGARERLGVLRQSHALLPGARPAQALCPGGGPR